MNMNRENDVILAVLKLSRAMRRCTPPGRPGPGWTGPGEPAVHPGHPVPFAPSVGRLLACVAENPNVSSRDLCEILDLRPSSLSEMLTRAESEGWITRTVDESDRRVQRVNLSPKGKSFIEQMEAARQKDLERKTACFTEEEKAQFCALCDKLSTHLESLALDLPEFSPRPEETPRKPRRPLPPGGRIRCGQGRNRKNSSGLIRQPAAVLSLSGRFQEGSSSPPVDSSSSGRVVT